MPVKPSHTSVALSSGARDKVKPVIFPGSRLQFKEMGNKYFEMVREFKYMERALTNRNCIHEKMKSKLNSSNAYHHSVQNRLSCSLLPQNRNIKIHRNIFLPVLFYTCTAWSLTLRKDTGWGCFENRVLRKIFRTKRGEETGEWRILHHKELYDLYSSPNIIRVIKSRKIRWAGHVVCLGEEKFVHCFGEETWKEEITP